MNILFVNYGDFTSNSLNHIGAFANRLTLLGHACVVAVPENAESISVVPNPLFTPATFERALRSEPIFPDRRPADVVHAWTPRENVREFTLAYLRHAPAAAFIVHLEDNERFLIESFAHEPIEKLELLSDEDLAARLSPRLSHPVRFRNFLRLAHGATYITDRLREFLPAPTPAHRLLPGIDAALYHPAPPDAELRASLGLKPGEKLLVFTGSTTFANLADIRTLLLAVRLINDRGTPCKLVRTGINPPELARELAALAGDHVIDLGFVEKARLGPLLAQADALVQPGTADAFNDYRLPSKIPEFLSVGRPTIIPRANLAREMIDGQHALLLERGTPDEIADQCLRVFNDPALAERLGAGALEFARSHFDLTANTASLLEFYAEIQTAAKPIIRDASVPVSDDVLIAQGDVALRMRAKEQTIARLRDLIRTHEAEATRLQAVLAERDRLVGAQDGVIAERNTIIAERNAIIAERNSVVAARERIIAERDAAIATLQEQIRALAATAQAEQAKLVAEANYHRAKLGQSHHQIEILRTQLADAATALGHLSRECDAMKARVDAVSAERNAQVAKIQRMTRSFSWQITTPLRALRRLLVDPYRRKASAREIRLPTADPTLICAIDEPANWAEMLPDAKIRGWLLSRDGTAITSVRIQLGSQTYQATCGLERPDVATAHASNPHALRSGFQLDYKLPPGSAQTVIIEAAAQGGDWRCAAAVRAQVAAEMPEHLRRDYLSWIRQFDTLTPEKKVALQARLEALDPRQRPLVSVLMPVYNTPEQWLTRAIESVRAQVYPHWELCIADDASPSAHVRAVLADFARRDQRIKVVHRGENGHISAASNSALELATGEFVALLDHDDELPPHALAEFVLQLAQTPETDLVYSDEDKIDEEGRRFSPYFKPDFLPELLTGQNFVSHLSVYRTSLVRSVGGFRVGYEGSQDWDLALRIVEKTTPERIRHIPKILYHWRAIAGSTARAVNEKDYTRTAARRALADHFARRGLKVELRNVPGDHWQIVYPLPPTPPLVSIIIPTKNAEQLLRLCIGSILAKTTYPNFEIVVVNNRSDDPATLAYFDELRRIDVRVLDYDAPFNYSALNNFAVREARGEVVCLLNNDVEIISPGWLDEMVSHAIRPEIGAVGAMLYYPDNTIQHAGVVLGIMGVANHAFLNLPRGTDGYMNRGRLAQNYSAVTGACLVIRRSVYEQVGGLNSTELAIAFNDVDFCLRVRAAGYRNVWTPFAELYHHESASRGTEDTAEKLARFHSEVAYMRDHWGEILDRDPAYNPNLTLERMDFSLSFPPRT